MLTWALRVLVAGIVVAGFNYWLWNLPSTEAQGTQRYAVVKETTYANSGYTGVKGYIFTGSPSPVFGDNFSNQTLWAANSTYCTGAEFPGSWIEVGWTKRGSSAPIYKFFYQVPQYNCVYSNSTQIGGPTPGSWHLYELQCTSCTGQVWHLYRDGYYQAQVATGWTYGRARKIQAGGEVSFGGIGMDGSSYQMQYKRGSTWYTAGFWDEEQCDIGYNLQYTTMQYDGITDYGWLEPGICDVRPR